jgi:hypothetical protein
MPADEPGNSEDRTCEVSERKTTNMQVERPNKKTRSYNERVL